MDLFIKLTIVHFVLSIQPEIKLIYWKIEEINQFIYFYAVETIETFIYIFANITSNCLILAFLDILELETETKLLKIFWTGYFQPGYL